MAAGNLIIESSFRTDIWDGKVEAFDTKELVDWLINGGSKPAPKWIANFPAAGSSQYLYRHRSNRGDLPKVRMASVDSGATNGPGFVQRDIGLA